MLQNVFELSMFKLIVKIYICASVYTLCIMSRELHQNKAGTSHRPVAFYLMKFQEYRSDKNSF